MHVFYFGRLFHFNYHQDLLECEPCMEKVEYKVKEKMTHFLCKKTSNGIYDCSIYN